MKALDMKFMGPQQPNGRAPEPGVAAVDAPADTRNVPTFTHGGAEQAATQLDYVFASRGFHEQVTARALNRIAEWGPSDHCRVMITVS